jgi:hypothetical protein
MLDGPFKAAMGITAYVLIVFVKACELSLGGAITLADVREPAVVILCHADAWALQHGAAHRQAWRRGSSRNTVMPRAARTARPAAGLSFSPAPPITAPAFVNVAPLAANDAPAPPALPRPNSMPPNTLPLPPWPPDTAPVFVNVASRR